MMCVTKVERTAEQLYPHSQTPVASASRSVRQMFWHHDAYMSITILYCLNLKIFHSGRLQWCPSPNQIIKCHKWQWWYCVKDMIRHITVVFPLVSLAVDFEILFMSLCTSEKTWFKFSTFSFFRVFIWPKYQRMMCQISCFKAQQNDQFSNHSYSTACQKKRSWNWKSNSAESTHIFSKQVFW